MWGFAPCFRPQIQLNFKKPTLANKRRRYKGWGDRWALGTDPSQCHVHRWILLLYVTLPLVCDRLDDENLRSASNPVADKPGISHKFT
jgi:hypothetical protein